LGDVPKNPTVAVEMSVGEMSFRYNIRSLSLMY
jgi:hypothetical protein